MDPSCADLLRYQCPTEILLMLFYRLQMSLVDVLLDDAILLPSLSPFQSFQS
jgi:hypothetical protein